MYKLKIIATSAAIACGTLYSLPSQAASLRPDQMFVFGDSLSDTDNIYNFTDIFLDPLPPFPPSPPYAKKMSNGDLWVEYIAKDLGLNPTSLFAPDQGVLTDGVNFAFAGSTTGKLNTVVTGFPALQTQVDAFLNLQATIPAVVKPDALYVIWGGANDYLPTQSPDFTPFTTPDQTVNNLIGAINALRSVGAKNFLIPNLPDLGKLPLTSSSPFADGLNQLTKQHNQLLAQRLAELNQAPGFDGEIIYADFDKLFNRALKKPSQFGFTDVTTPCVNLQISLNACSNPDEHLFWDPIHPTTKAHQIFGEYALKQLKAGSGSSASVPEPTAVIGLFALGAIAVGQKLRRSA